MQCISYFPCLLNKDIDKSWWPFGDQEGAINALLRKSLHNYYLLTHDQYYLYPGYSIPYVQNNKWTICINEYGSHVGRVNRYQSQSNCWNRLHVMAICWVNVKYYEIWRLSFVIFTYLRYWCVKNPVSSYTWTFNSTYFINKKKKKVERIRHKCINHFLLIQHFVKWSL